MERERVSQSVRLEDWRCEVRRQKSEKRFQESTYFIVVADGVKVEHPLLDFDIRTSNFARPELDAIMRSPRRAVPPYAWGACPLGR